MKSLALAVGGTLLALSSVAAARMGGWAVVTVEDVPERLVAGKPLDLTFVVRQHGVTPLGDLTPRIEARSGSRRETKNAWATQRTGTYRGRITVPDTGLWTITIHTGFGRSKGTLLPLRALGSASATSARLEESERGRMLFAAKGCVTCHVRDGVGVDGEVQKGAPDLTGRRFPPDYLGRFLADPSIKPPSTELYMRMPNLELKRHEIASLAAFINSERKLTIR